MARLLRQRSAAPCVRSPSKVLPADDVGDFALSCDSPGAALSALPGLPDQFWGGSLLGSN